MAGKTDFSRLSATIQSNQEKSQKRGSKFEKVEWLTIPYGDTTFMIMPPKDENSDFFVEEYVHHNFKDSKGKKRSYLCSRKRHGKCPICDRVAALTKEGLTKDASAIRGQKTFLYNVRDYNLNKKVAPLKPSQHNEVIQELNAHHADQGIDATDPANGTQIKLSRLKAAPWARARILAKKVELTAERIAEFSTGLADLGKVYIDNTPEELAKMLSGEDINVAARKEAGVSETADDAAAVAEEVTEVAAAPVTAAVVITPVAGAPAQRGRPAKAAAPAPVASTEDDPELAAIMKDLEN